MLASEGVGGISFALGEPARVSETYALALACLFEDRNEAIARDIQNIAFEQIPLSSESADSFRTSLHRILLSLHALAGEILRGFRDLDSAAQDIEKLAFQAVAQRLSLGVKLQELLLAFSRYKKYYRDLILESLKALGGSLDDLAAAYGLLDFIFDNFVMTIGRGYLKMASLAMELAPVGIATLTSARRFVSWNPHAEKITGWTEQEILKMECSHLFRRSGNAKPTPEPCPIQEALSNKISFISAKGNIIILGKDGREIPVFLGLVPAVENGWEISEFVLVFYDLSSQKKAEKTRIDFLTTLVRDFREPLMTIRSCATFLSREDLDKDQLESSNVILRMSQTLIPFVDNLARLLELEARRK
ncbi:MAG: PAS domain-containing protein [bacterium]